MGYAQNIFWLNGSWEGKAYFPGSDGWQSYDAVLKVYNIKANKFEGIIAIMQSSDTSVRFDSRISGIVYDKYLIIKREKILYVKNAPGIQWKVSCNNCKPPHMIFSIEKEKFFFRGEGKDCYKECNGITEFSKDITEFDSSAKASVYALVNGMSGPEAGTTSIAENNPSLNNTSASLLTEDNQVAERISPIPAGTITLTEHNATSPSLKTQAGLLHENLSMKIKESEPKRIPVLTAGTIAVSKHNTDLLLHQKQSYSLLQKTPSAIIKETEQKRIRVLSAGPITLSKHNTNLFLPQKQLYSLQRTTTSRILKETEQKRLPVLPAGDIVSAKPTHHDTIVMLPAGYAERKKNIVRTLIVNTDSIVLRVYDNGVVDGDIVSVIYNDHVVIDRLSLTARALEIKIPVNKTGINSLVFHAHNLGEFPPNTAKLEIIYGNKREELTVASDLTVSSTIDMVHKQ
jgi:hypothetical protein